MKSASTIRIGLIGAGGIAKSRHLPGFKKIPGVELAAVCNRTEESSRRIATEWGIKRIEKTPEKLIQSRDVDAILIGTWPYVHCRYACAALKAGKHVFTQARMASNLSEAKTMLAAARRHPRQVSMICPSPFGMLGTLYVQELIRRDYIGKIRLVNFQQLNSGLADGNSPIHWRQQKQFNGLNTLAYGIYVERFLQWFGPIDSVQATGTIFTPLRKDSQGKRTRVDAPDQLQVVAQLKSHPGQLNMIFSGVTHHAPQKKCEIFGEKGTLTVDFVTDEIHGAVAGDSELRLLEIPPEFQRVWTVEQDFIDAIRAGGARKLPAERTRFFPPDFLEGTRYMAVTEATARSIKTGKREKIPSIP